MAFEDPDTEEVTYFRPYGFSPREETEETDYQATLGVKGVIGTLTWDLSSSYGEDEIDMFTRDSANATLYAAEGDTGINLFTNGVTTRTRGIDLSFSYGMELGSANVDWTAATATVSEDQAHGRKLYDTCAACHGTRGEGNTALQSPALAARSDWYLAAQLANYKAALRGADDRDIYGAQMRAIAATLPDDKAIADVVAYINTLK